MAITGRSAPVRAPPMAVNTGPRVEAADTIDPRAHSSGPAAAAAAARAITTPITGPGRLVNQLAAVSIAPAIASAYGVNFWPITRAAVSRLPLARSTAPDRPSIAALARALVVAVSFVAAW